MQGTRDRLGKAAAASPGLRIFEARERRRLAGMVNGLLYLTAGAAALLYLALPGPRPRGAVEMALLGVAAVVWSAACVSIVPWERAARWASYASTAATLPLLAALMAASGGSESPFRFYLTFVVVFAAYFYGPREAVAYAVGCLLAVLSPALYAGLTGGELREIAILTPAFALLAASMMAARRTRRSLSHRAQTLADEQAALRRVATAVAAGSPPTAVFTLVASETLRLVGADMVSVAKFDRPDSGVVVGVWSADDSLAIDLGTRVSLLPGHELAALQVTGESLRVDDFAPDSKSPSAILGYRSMVCVPVHVHGRLWGSLGAMSRIPARWDDETERRLADFSDLLTTAIADTEDRARLAAQAGTDPLTGLANHRTLQERLREEISRAGRHGRPLTLALIDVDHFKGVNRGLGHELGDEILLELAARLSTVVRTEDVLARVGGDEFAVLLPDTDRHTAFAILERARMLVAGEPFRHRARLTVSTGICDMDTAADPDAMYRLADGALYWSKVQGRDVTWIYDATVVRELSAHERAEHLERSQALVGLRALARAIDAKDPSTREHSERVATLACLLAEAAGWPRGRVSELHEAALVHDVGKIGVPDAVLLKPGRLDRDEYELIKEHAALGARIVSEVLSAEQVHWVRCHHERPDGRGYPDGIPEDEIPDGAELLAMADSWDVMTSVRPYSAPMPPREALAEARSLIGAQFTRAAVDALEALFERGALTDDATLTAMLSGS